MREVTRRGFIASAIAVFGSPLLTLLDDKVIVARNEFNRADWIRDDGDFYTVVVPEKKSMRNEFFDKPLLLIMGNHSVFDGNRVHGFLNAYLKDSCLISSCYFDSSHYKHTKERPVLDIKTLGSGSILAGNNYIHTAPVKSLTHSLH